MQSVASIGTGIGLRRENVDDLLARKPADIQCIEIAPENFLHTGGKMYRKFRELAEIYPVVAHGLSLSVASLAPLDQAYLKDLKLFLRDHRLSYMTDHLCYSSLYGAQFHDLLPVPFTREAIRHIVPRVKQIQDFLEVPFALENVSYYAAPAENEMTEWDFVSEVVNQADCSLHLDVNNIYVNSVNHGFDPLAYVRALPLERVLHVHLAGHVEYQGFLLDNHGAPIIDPVWEILREVAPRIAPAAVIIERDHRMPPLDELIEEVKTARAILQSPEQAASSRGIDASERTNHVEGVFGFQL